MKRPADLPIVPKHLGPESKEFFSRIVGTFELETHHLKLLRLACEAYDRTQEARKILAKEGLTAQDARGGIKCHPAIAIERDSRLAFARLLREIGLPSDADEEAPRAPAIQGRYRW